MNLWWITCIIYFKFGLQLQVCRIYSGGAMWCHLVHGLNHILSIISKTVTTKIIIIIIITTTTLKELHWISLLNHFVFFLCVLGVLIGISLWFGKIINRLGKDLKKKFSISYSFEYYSFLPFAHIINKN